MAEQSGSQRKIKITRRQLDELLAVRDEGQFNMFDYSGVRAYAWSTGRRALAVWMRAHRPAWGRVIVGGEAVLDIDESVV